VLGWLVLYYTLEVLKWLVIVRAVLSWFASPDARNPFVEALRRITDPILRPLSSIVPTTGGIDLTPLVAFFLIILLQSFIVRLA
jgi:YggT family protein